MGSFRSPAIESAPEEVGAWVSTGINSCRDYDLDAAAALTATTFGVADGHIATVRVLTLLG